MKLSQWGGFLVVVAFLSMLVAPGVQAARHDIDMNVGFFGGYTYLEGEDEADSFEEDGGLGGKFYGLGYTFYFNELRDEEMPNDLKVFLQHPAQVFARISGGSYEKDTDIEYDDSDFEQDRKYELSYRDFELGGSYYFPSNTGLGLAVRLGKSEEEYDREASDGSSYSYDGDGDRRRINFWVDQYLGEKHRLRFVYSNFLQELDYDNSSGNEWSTDETTNWFVFNYKAAFGGETRFVLDLDLGYGKKEFDYESGDDDKWRLYNFAVAFGPAFNRFAIYFYFDYTSWNPDDGDVSYDRYEFDYGINPRFWFGDRVGMSINLFGQVDYRDYPEDSLRDERTDVAFGTDISLTVRF